MVYHALDSPDDDYHALFVLCLLYAMSHNKGKTLALPDFLTGPCICIASFPSAAWRTKKGAFCTEFPFWFWWSFLVLTPTPL